MKGRAENCPLSDADIPCPIAVDAIALALADLPTATVLLLLHDAAEPIAVESACVDVDAPFPMATPSEVVTAFLPIAIDADPVEEELTPIAIAPKVPLAVALLPMEIVSVFEAT